MAFEAEPTIERYALLAFDCNLSPHTANVAVYSFNARQHLHVGVLATVLSGTLVGFDTSIH